MNKLLVILFLFVSNSLFAQKYMKLEPVIAPDSAGCNGKARAVLYGGSLPNQNISWWTGSSEISSDMEAENLCDSELSSLTIQDSDCSRLHAEIRLYSDTSLQITLDTIYITLPSGPGMCDGSVQLIYNNITPNHSGSFDLQQGLSPYTGPEDSTFTYTGICEGEYTATVILDYEGVLQIGINMFLTPTTLYDCQLFESEILINSPTSSSSCDGGIVVNPIYGPDGPYRHLFIFNFPGGGGDILNANEYENFIDNLCPGSYTIQVQNDSTYLTKYYRIFLDTNGIIQVPWNFPDSLLPDTDTILLNALMDCNINYNIGIDTAYISSFNGIGNNQYDIEITFIQDTNTIIINSYALVDTSLNFFLDITTFCPDSTRSNSGYYSLRSMFYHGVKLQSTQSINENNLLSSFKIYPNPSENIFQIDFETIESSLLNFEVTDITGKIIRSIDYLSVIGKNHMNLDLDRFASGLYLLNVQSEKGLMQSKKLIKN
jgi:hypothetical protein